MKSSKERRTAFSNPEPNIFSIQHFCIHDGPGIRSVIFFKGCPLRCAWCQNPESWNRAPEIAYKKNLCIGCGRCATACPSGSSDKPVFRNPDLCVSCFRCAGECPSGALIRLGEVKSVDEIVEELRPEFPLYRESGGGVTFSGGEPALYPEFCALLAGRLRRLGIHTAMETSGMFDMDAAKRLVEAIDLILFDIKLFSGRNHKKHCGTDNRLIIKNLSLVAGMGKKTLTVLPRLPLVPGVTDTRSNIAGWAGLLRELGIRHVSIIPYHRMGNDKRLWLGLDAAPAFPVPSEDDNAATRRLFARYGIAASFPGEESDPCSARPRF